ncbi:MAG TPA: hypothetical protein DD827_00715 [Gammaproteobacteria bacterium]|nr:hypothetical protein [Gammaproteobacteria bacterium]
MRIKKPQNSKKLIILGLVGLTIVSLLNLAADIFFHQPAANLSHDGWYSVWFPGYISWFIFLLIGLITNATQHIKQ